MFSSPIEAQPLVDNHFAAGEFFAEEENLGLFIISGKLFFFS